MNKEITVRVAQPADSGGIAELMGQLGYPATLSEVEDRLTRLSSLDSERVIVAEQDGRIVGIVGVHLTPLLHESGNLGRIIALVVEAGHRGHGIGRRLVSEAESWAWNHSCSRMEVTSGDHRSDAHRFYEACGYRCDERRFLKRRTASQQAPAVYRALRGG